MATVSAIERLANVVFGSSRAQERREAEAQLMTLRTPQCLGDLIGVFDQSTSTYALMISATAIAAIIGKLDSDQRLSTRNYMLNYLLTSGPALDGAVLNAVVSIVAKSTKIGWFDGDAAHRDVVEKCLVLFDASVELCPIALRCLKATVDEVNLVSARGDARSLTMQRKCAVSFRDTSLWPAMQVAVDTLRRLRAREGLDAVTLSQEESITAGALDLAVACLGYDFIGTNVDESAEDAGSVQLPAAWSSLVTDPALLATLFEVFAAQAPPRSDKAMQAMILLSSTRRSLFSSGTDRARFLNQLLRGLRDILATKQGLQHADNYHDFCRLLGRLKSNYQLSELVNADVYAEFLQLACNFTAQSFAQWRWAGNSLQDLLALWGKLVAAVPYVRVAAEDASATSTPTKGSSTTAPRDALTLLERSVAEVARLYVKAMVESVAVVAQADGAVDDPLEDVGLVEELDRLCGVARCQYAVFGEYVSQLLDSGITGFQNALTACSRAGANRESFVRLQIVERQLAWLAYVVGAVVGGASLNQLPLASGDEVVDAELAKRVFEVSRLVDYRAAAGLGASPRCEVRLELGLLHFFTAFRRAYMWEPASTAAAVSVAALARIGAVRAAGASRALDDDSATISQPSAKQKIFLKLFEVLALGDCEAVMNVVVAKICHNLVQWPECENIVKDTLQLLLEMSSGLSSGKFMLKLQAVRFLLDHHCDNAALPFLAVSANARHRTTLHTTLSRLVFCVGDARFVFSVGDDGAAAFDAFVEPMVDTLRKLAQTDLQSGGEAVHFAVIGVCRDLRGVAAATHNKRTYDLLFEAIYPHHVSILSRVASQLGDVPQVATALLRFMKEFVYNKGQRIHFDHSSANGILLFREASKVVVHFGSRHLERLLQAPDDASSADAYRLRHKGVVLALSVLTAALDGGYVNFGVFALYNDSALDDALDICVRLSLAAPREDVAALPKLAKAIFAFYEVLLRDHVAYVLCRDAATFAAIVQSLASAVDDPLLAAPACAAADHLATFGFTKRAKDVPATHALQAHLQRNPNLLADLLQTLLNQLLFGPPANHWVLTRPVLPLILCDERAFVGYQNELVNSQGRPEIRARLVDALATLMANVHRSLEPANRDAFGQALSAFRVDVRTFLVC